MTLLVQYRRRKPANGITLEILLPNYFRVNPPERQLSLSPSSWRRYMVLIRKLEQLKCYKQFV
jgi:hypothetical protein